MSRLSLRGGVDLAVGVVMKVLGYMAELVHGLDLSMVWVGLV